MGVRARQVWVATCDGPLNTDANSPEQACKEEHQDGALSELEAAAAALNAGWRFPPGETAAGKPTARALALCPAHALDAV